MQESAPETARRASLVPLDEERRVVSRIKLGDRAAFSILYGWYGDHIFRAILSKLPERESAEDCLRDTFRTVLEKISSFEHKDRSIFYWIRRIAINKAMDAHRRTRRDRELVDRVQAHGAAQPTGHPRPDRPLEVADTAREVELSLSRLNERYATVLRLRLIEERPRSECAELLGITVSNLDVLVHRAAKAFRKVYPP